jgi:hypothetical protein
MPNNNQRNEAVRRLCIVITVKINHLASLLTAISSWSVNIDTGKGLSSFVLTCSIVLFVWKHVRKRGWVKAVTQDKESSDALLVFFGNVKHLGYNRLTIMGTIVIAISVELYCYSDLRKEDGYV